MIFKIESINGIINNGSGDDDFNTFKKGKKLYRKVGAREREIHPNLQKITADNENEAIEKLLENLRLYYDYDGLQKSPIKFDIKVNMNKKEYNLKGEKGKNYLKYYQSSCIIV